MRGYGKGTWNDFNCTYDWLVSWEFVPKVEHEQHESNKPEELFAHC